MSAFRRLRRRLAIAYAVSSVIAIVALEAVLLALLGWYVLRSQAFVDDLARGTEETAARVAMLAVREPLDREALSRVIADAFTSAGEGVDEPIQLSIEVGPMRGGIVTLVDGSGASRYAFACRRTGCVDAPPPVPTTEERERIERALAGVTPPSTRAFRRADGGVSVAHALRAPDGSGAGAIWARLEPPFTPGSWVRASARFLATNGAVVAILGGLVGLAFGAIVTRGIAQRLDRIGRAAKAWAGGRFDVVASNSSHDDELQDLAAGLDAMATELRGAVALREALAAAQEGSRLARELHDGVKQQLFATAMLLGAARATAERDPTRTTARIDEASGLLENAQRELVAVLAQLRPSSLDAPWPDALRREVLAWSRRTGIAAHHVTVDAQLQPAIGDALMRIVQEALSNVARHSGAANVDVRFQSGPGGELSLRIDDDGQGMPDGTQDGFGITSMRARVAALPGGMLRLMPSVRGGLCVEVTFREAE